VAFWVPPTSPAKGPVIWKVELAWKAGTRSMLGLSTVVPTASFSWSPGRPRMEPGIAGVPGPPSSTV
jgi:hypothetical protein